MKIRNGFVSNSSSSSFIVAFPKGFKASKEAVKEYVFGDRQYISAYDHGASTKNAATTIYADMKRKKPSVRNRIKDALGGYLMFKTDIKEPKCDDIVTADINNLDLWRKQWQEYDKLSKAFRDQLADKILEEWKDYDLYVFKYADEDGSYFAALEHGGTFERVPHKVISNH